MNRDKAPIFIDGPAVVGAGHVRNRPATDDKGRLITGKSAWRRLSPLETAFAKNQLAGGCARFTAAQRFEAGTNYAQIFHTAQTSGRDSTQALNVSRSTGGDPLSQSQATAIRARIVLESHMAERDRAIIRMVCGEGYGPAEAVRHVCGDYRDTVSARFREALDSLIEAFETSRRHPDAFSASRKTSAKT